MSFKKRIVGAVERMQPLVEDELGVKIGKVDVIPIASDYLRVSERVEERYGHVRATGILKPLEFLLNSTRFIEAWDTELNSIAHAQAGYSTLSYNRNPLVHRFRWGEERLDHIAAHELTHMVHFRLLGTKEEYKPIVNKLPNWLIEGFPEYVARVLVARKYGESLDKLRGVYDKEVEIFSEECIKNGTKVSDIKDLAKIVRELSTREKRLAA